LRVWEERRRLKGVGGHRNNFKTSTQNAANNYRNRSTVRETVPEKERKKSPGKKRLRGRLWESVGLYVLRHLQGRPHRRTPNDGCAVRTRVPCMVRPAAFTPLPGLDLMKRLLRSGRLPRTNCLAVGSVRAPAGGKQSDFTVYSLEHPQSQTLNPQPSTPNPNS